MSNNHKGHMHPADAALAAAQAEQASIAGQLEITVFNNSRPPRIRCTVDPLGSLQLVIVALQGAVNTLLQQAAMKSQQADPVDKERKFLGPRETVSYGKGE